MNGASLVSLPVELIAYIFSDLDIPSLRSCSELCSYLRAVVSDPLLNPWRGPILRALSEHTPSDLKTLSVLSTVPRNNWLEILCYASPEFLLFETTLPNLSDEQYKAAFRRRFLPSWAKIRKAGPWREAFLKMLFSVYHRSTTNCTTSEAWTNFIIVNRTGVANSTTVLSRTFDPVALYNTIKDNANMAHLDTSVRLVVRLADVRVIMFGMLHRNTSLFKNPTANLLLHPPDAPSPPLHPSIDTSPHITFDDSDGDSSSESDTDALDGINTPLPPSPEPSSPLVELARRARSVSSPAPGPSSASPSLPFWRTRSRDSAGSNEGAGGSTSRTSHAHGHSSSVGGGSVLPTFMSRLFASPASLGSSHTLREASPTPSQVPTQPQSPALTPMGSPVIAHVSPTGADANEEDPSRERAVTNGHGHHHHHHNHHRRHHEPASPRARAREHQQLSLPTTQATATVTINNAARQGLNPMQYPTPHPIHALYPNYTPGGDDWRWYRTRYADSYPNSSCTTRMALEKYDLEDEERTWIGPILIVAQLYPTFAPPEHDSHPLYKPDQRDDPLTFERRILDGSGLHSHGRWASFGWADLWAIAPWLDDPDSGVGITKRVDGVGLGMMGDENELHHL